LLNSQISGRVTKLRKDLDKGKAQEEIIQDYDFMVSPTCPPSTSIYIREGKAWRNAAYWFVIGYRVQKPTVTIDLTTERIVDNNAGAGGNLIDLNFENPYHYKAFALVYNGDWIFYEQYGIDHVLDECAFYSYGGEAEHATAAEAEAEIDLILNGGAVNSDRGEGLYYEDAFPLWSLILRNNGTIGTAGQIMPIDKLNRERSYLYRDLRPGKNWITS
jgi:hypothetical protein